MDSAAAERTFRTSGGFQNKSARIAKPQKSIGSTLQQNSEISGQEGLVQEIVTSVWINELEMGLKMYDIMSLMKHGSTEGSCA